MNHIGWIYGIRKYGRDIAEPVPLKYFRFQDRPESVLDERRRAMRPRGAELDEISRKAFEAYSYGDESQIRKAIEVRSAPWYAYAFGPLIEALARREVQVRCFLSTLNDAFDPAFRHDDVLECAYMVQERRLRRISRTKPVPEYMFRVISPLVQYERIATAAVMTGEPTAVEEALRVHPWLNRCNGFRAMARDVVNYASYC